MKVIQKSLELQGSQYYEKHLSIISPMLPEPFTHKEITVLAAFMALPESVTEDDKFNSLARKKVRQQLSLSAGGLSNYLGSMIKKGFLTKSEISKKIKIKEYLVPEEDFQGYMFKLTKK